MDTAGTPTPFTVLGGRLVLWGTGSGATLKSDIRIGSAASLHINWKDWKILVWMHY